MPKSVIIAAGRQNNAAAIAPSTTVWYKLTAEFFGNTTDNNAKANLRPDGTLSNLTVFTDTNSISATSTVTLRKNGANGSQTVSIGSNATGVFNDRINRDSISGGGDDVNHQLTTGGTGTSITLRVITIVFEPTNTALIVTKVGGGFFAAQTTASLNTFASVCGVAFDTTEANTQRRLGKNGTLIYLDVRISSNARTTTTTIRTRKNTANGNMSVSIGSTATGEFEDIANSDIINVNDLVNFNYVHGTGTQSITTQNISVSFQSTSPNMFVPLILSASTSNLFNAIASWFLPMGGNITATAAQAETVYLVPIRLKGIISNFHINVAANTATVVTGRIRINQTNSNLSVSIGSGQSGFFEDNTNTNEVKVDDILTNLVQLTSGTNITIKSVQSWITIVLEPTETPKELGDTNLKFIKQTGGNGTIFG